jgi:hypothetical protein
MDPKPNVAIVDDSEQAWINKYRAAIPETPPKSIFKRVVARLGYLLGIILGKSKRPTVVRARPQPLEEIGIKSTKRKRSGKRDRNLAA